MPAQRPDRNLALELVRVTESAAMAGARWVGRGDKNGADGAAVDAMRTVLSTVPMTGLVVIGEGEKDDAPMLFNGESVGNYGMPARGVVQLVVPSRLWHVGVNKLDLTMPSRIDIVRVTARTPS